MILSVGEILYDVFPGYKRLGGAPFNFAFHVKNLGVPLYFVSRVGADSAGETILQQLRQMEFDISHIQIDEKNRTGEVVVTIDENQEPDFNILPDVAYDYINHEPVCDMMSGTNMDLIYFGTLVQRSEYGFATIQRVLMSKSPATRCFYDVNLRKHCYDRTIIDASMKQADILKVNETELGILKQLFQGIKKNDSAFINYLMNHYHIEMVALTRGSRGSDLYTRESHHVCKAHRIEKTINSVGAGDAYSSILAMGYLRNWQPEKILSIATAFAAKLCEIDGAIPASTSFYDDWRLIFEEATGE